MKRTDSTSLTLIAIPVCVLASIIIAATGSDNLQSLWASVGNWFVALGAFLFAIAVVPNFSISKAARLAAMVFFLTMGLRHVGVALTYLIDPDSDARDLISAWYFATLAAVQAFAIWAFLLGIRERQIVDRQRIANMRGNPEFGRRAADTEEASRE